MEVVIRRKNLAAVVDVLLKSSDSSLKLVEMRIDENDEKLFTFKFSGDAGALAILDASLDAHKYVAPIED